MRKLRNILFIFVAFLVVGVTNVEAKSFQEMLNDKKLEIKSIKPTNDEEAWAIISDYIYYEDDTCYADNFSNNYQIVVLFVEMVHKEVLIV